MRALILAAGRGKRLRPYTDVVPKPLLVVAEGDATHPPVRLIDWQIAAACRAGVERIVVNTAHLADAFEPLPAELAARGVDMAISREGDCADDALESLGGIVKALPLLAPADDPRLCDEPFFVLAGDVVHAFDLRRFDAAAEAMRAGRIDAHLVAVPNPDFHAAGDMTVAADGTIVPGPGPHTYGCLMLASPRIFRPLRPEPAKLFPWLWDLALSGRVTAEVYTGFWDNVGSPREYERLKADAAALAWARY